MTREPKYWCASCPFSTPYWKRAQDHAHVTSHKRIRMEPKEQV